VGVGEDGGVAVGGGQGHPYQVTGPDAYDVRRANTADHLAFAHGPHFCFGAHLARLETRTALRALLALPGLRLAPGPSPAPRGLVFRKPDAVRVRWDAFTL
ncbi:MAG TPA: cytochrome P450, partial [Thermomonospora sp.]|nr:cytochrome P450 [Thermomonospora sp.]